MKKHAPNPQHAEARPDLDELREVEAACPYCHTQLPVEDPGVVFRTSWWRVIGNPHPPQGSSLSLIIIYHQHTTNPGEVVHVAWPDLYQNVLGWAKEQFNMQGGCLHLCFGHRDYIPQSIPHLHCYLTAGGPYRNRRRTLKIAVGYEKEP